LAASAGATRRFLYHQADNQVALGFVTWLNYETPISRRLKKCAALEAASGTARYWKVASVFYGARDMTAVSRPFRNYISPVVR
jgi:hypothetical protein